MKKRKNLNIWLPMLMFLLLMVSTATAEIIYVDVDANGVNDGSDWTDAYNYLQDALAVSSSGDEIWVAQGTYKPDLGVGITPGDREATFQLKNGVAIRGGYAGFGEPDPNARDIELYETILSGDLNGNDVDVPDPCDLLDHLTRAENSFHVVTGSGTNETAILDGFIITGGNANGSSYSQKCGGGMYNNSGSPTLINCAFNGNSARFGGGMRNRDESSPAMTNCTFRDNSSARRGGGMYNEDSSPKLSNCTFSRNSARSKDGYEGFGGGMFSSSSSSPTLRDCLFRGNLANDGAGMYNGGSDIMLVNCAFIGNSACTGGAIFCHDGDTAVRNCTFAGNSAANGNALACNSYVGVWPGRLHIVNSILWDGGVEIWNKDGSATTIICSDVQGGQTAVYDPCDGVIWGEGNIDVDPCFADANNSDYHLESQAGRWDANEGRWTKDEVTSPCIDAGDPSSPIGLEPFPNGGIINMGAYGGTVEASKSYFGEPVCETIVVGDINGDCRVNFKDFALIALHWLEYRRPNNSNSIVEDKIEYYIQTDKSIYHIGEDVEILYRVTNLGEDGVVLGRAPRPPYCYRFFITDDDSKHVWQWPWAWPIDVGNFYLGPYQSKEHQIIWNMINDNETWFEADDFPAGPGVYNVAAHLRMGTRNPVSVSIEIIP